MKRLLPCVVALSAVLCAPDTELDSQQSPHATMQPEDVVRSLYRQVVSRHPVGIPTDAGMKTFAPYLSKSLLRRIDLARAWEEDYYRGHQNPSEKPQLEWLEFGLFTGGNEKVPPRAFRVEKTQSEKDGSSRVDVRLTWGTSSKPWIWRVAAMLVQENSYPALDDVIFLKDETLDAEWRLSEILARGCHGPTWVGYGDKR